LTTKGGLKGSSEDTGPEHMAHSKGCIGKKGGKNPSTKKRRCSPEPKGLTKGQSRGGGGAYELVKKK